MRGIVALALLAGACTMSRGSSKGSLPRFDWKTYHKKHPLAFPAHPLAMRDASFVILDGVAESQTKRGDRFRWVITLDVEYTNHTAHPIPSDVLAPDLQTGLDCTDPFPMLVPDRLPPGWQWAQNQPVALAPRATGRVTLQSVCSGDDLFANPIELTAREQTVVLTER